MVHFFKTFDGYEGDESNFVSFCSFISFFFHYFFLLFVLHFFTFFLNKQKLSSSHFINTPWPIDELWSQYIFLYHYILLSMYISSPKAVRVFQCACILSRVLSILPFFTRCRPEIIHLYVGDSVRQLRKYRTSFLTCFSACLLYILLFFFQF